MEFLTNDKLVIVGAGGMIGSNMGMEDRLTLLNNWENTGFDFNQQSLAELMKDAKDLGVLSLREHARPIYGKILGKMMRTLQVGGEDALGG